MGETLVKLNKMIRNLGIWEMNRRKENDLDLGLTLVEEIDAVLGEKRFELHLSALITRCSKICS